MVNPTDLLPQRSKLPHRIPGTLFRPPHFANRPSLSFRTGCISAQKCTVSHPDPLPGSTFCLPSCGSPRTQQYNSPHDNRLLPGFPSFHKGFSAPPLAEPRRSSANLHSSDRLRDKTAAYNHSTDTFLQKSCPSLSPLPKLFLYCYHHCPIV